MGEGGEGKQEVVGLPMHGSDPAPSQEGSGSPTAPLPSEVLEKAAALIEPEGAWIQGDWARDAEGRGMPYGYNPTAICWCLDGALECVTGPDGRGIYKAAVEFTCRVVDGDDATDLFMWNDEDERDQAEVVTALREAAALARSEGQ